MRVTLKKVVTSCITIGVFFLLVFNFYNRSLWIYESNTHPDNAEYNKIHKPVMPYEKNGIHTTLYGLNGHLLRNVTVAINPMQPLAAKTTRLVVWPDKEQFNDDRIVAQLEYKPKWLEEKETKKENLSLKQIFLYSGFGNWQVKQGQETFKEQNCRVNTCSLVAGGKASEADAILFQHMPARPNFQRPNSQIWILFLLESPNHTPGLNGFENVFNWTASYRHDSDIVAPYEKFVRYNESVKTLPQNKSYAVGKVKQVAWFVSNCGARNGRREYANELAKYIQVDIYGGCGDHMCPRHDSGRCFEMLSKEYKFYLAFENSNCRDYITEKFFVNGLSNDIIPIVMGAAPEDYERAAPPHSYIHVEDFETPKLLAEYLHKLDQNDDLYNEYFAWKGTGRLINTYFWCRVCAMLHDDTRTHSSYKDIERWWRGNGVCIGKDTWRSHPRSSKFIIEDYLS
ncbi:hypothetical protein ACJMK2_019506 [Sinanodonta woodiana]|uniref:Fucosyltransferase n=1 Tax=Sinanodonta woodiana TaxID=1069815 RepID=A0ABD3TWZ9_SINWO